ncbi:MAG: DNA polymerase III subunit gamma/tau [Rickettsiales bacterium]
MSFYVPLHIKYRPKYLSDVIGQDIFINIINYIIKAEKLYYSYIFSGTRGVGKTTLARIIAKTINCENIILNNHSTTNEKLEDLQNNLNIKKLKNNNLDISSELDKDNFDINNQLKNLVKNCEKCSSCLTNAASDIIEIDAASNTGVDNIREIIESSSYIPLSKYKVFIIDEVHMLSKNAFNAFLKTLEEPKTKVIFILATTEIEKVPLTILSRCQRFDLKPINIQDIEKLLTKICKLENIQYEEKTLNTIAKLANGSARDALSFLEQTNNYINSLYFESNNNSILLNNQVQISNKILNNLFSIISENLIFNIIFAIFGNDIFYIYNNIHSNIDIYQLIIKLLEMLSALIQVKILHTNQLSITELKNITNLEDDFLLKKVIELINNIELYQIITCWKILTKHLDIIKTIENKLSYFQMLNLLIIKKINKLSEFTQINNSIKENNDSIKKNNIPLKDKINLIHEENIINSKHLICEENIINSQDQMQFSFKKQIKNQVNLESNLNNIKTNNSDDFKFNLNNIKTNDYEINNKSQLINSLNLLSNSILSKLITSLNNDFEFEIYYFLMKIIVQLI